MPVKEKKEEKPPLEGVPLQRTGKKDEWAGSKEVPATLKTSPADLSASSLEFIRSRRKKVDEKTRLGIELIFAIRTGDLKKAKELIEGGVADVNARGPYGSTALINSGAYGKTQEELKAYTEIGRLLIEKGAKITARDEYNSQFSAPYGTAHRIASDRGHTEFVKMIETALAETKRAKRK